MKITIDHRGFLSIKRADQPIDQYCPFADEERCGDWCPLFGEPEQDDAHNTKGLILRLCHTAFFGEIDDQRAIEDVS